MPRHVPQDLNPQGLRLSSPAKKHLEALAEQESGDGRLTPSEVARGLLMVALHLASAPPGDPFREALRTAARTPTPEGLRAALAQLPEAHRSPRLAMFVDTSPTAPDTPKGSEI